MKSVRRAFALLLTAFMLTGLVGAPVPALADGTLVMTLGADLNAQQKQGILEFFNVNESDVSVITVTNQDERKLLEGQYTEAQIGKKTYSCALVNPTSSGGIQVKTANLSVVTSGRIASILSTSGITDCEVLAAAPFMVSGTGALTGVMMGYEQALGVDLDPEKQQMAIQESTTVTKIGEKMGQEEATLVVNDIKIRIVRDKAKDDAQIADAVNTTVDQVEEQLAQLAAVKGKAAPKKLGQEDRDVLCDYGRKISGMNYDYDRMKLTLQRVTVNAANAIGIDDPITETFEDLSAEDVLPENSILRSTNDESMGKDANITATDTASMEGAPTLEDAVATATLNKSLYALFDLPMTWSDARRYCRDLGGDLASITTLDEQAAVEALAAQSSKDYCWVGGKRDAQYNDWWWSDGNSFKFTNWDENQPDNYNQNEFFMRMATRDINYGDWSAHAGKWNDAAENGDAKVPLDVFGFICEIPQERAQAEADVTSADTGARVTGIRLTPVQSVDGPTRFHYGTSLLYMDTDAGNGLMDMNGNMITEQFYDYINSSTHGLIPVTNRTNDGEVTGILDQGGHIVVPCEYNDVKVLSPRWVVGIKWDKDGTEDDCDYIITQGDNKYYGRITTADVYYVKDGAGTLLKSLSRQEYGGAEAKEDYIRIDGRGVPATVYDSAFNVVAENVTTYSFDFILPPEYSAYSDYDAEHNCGVQDASGNIVLQPFADGIYEIRNGLVHFYMSDADYKTSCGIASLDGSILLPPEYDNIYSDADGPVDSNGEDLYRWNHMGYYLTVKDGIYRFAVDGGEISNDTGVANDAGYVNSYNLALCRKDDGGQFTLYAVDGQTTPLGGDLQSCNGVSASMGLIWKTTNATTYQEDLIDWHGNVLIGNIYYASLSGDGSYLAVRMDYDGPLDIYAVTYVFDDGHELSPEGVEAATVAGEEPAPAGNDPTPVEAEPAENAEAEAPGQTPAVDSAALIATLENTVTTIKNADFDANREQIANILETEANLLADINADSSALLSSAATLVRSGSADANTTVLLLQSAIDQMK